MRPAKTDYAEYYQKYIDLIEGDDIIHILLSLNNEASDVFNSFPQSKGDFSYAEGKWTVKEVAGHMMDTDRIFAYRALAIARGEKQPFPSFNQDEYVKNGKFGDRELSDLTYEYRLVRESNLLMFKGFDQFVYSNRGIAAGNEVTVLALMWMIAGHQKHHLNILRENISNNYK
ncbi:MAG: DinB family protein [Ignavibacterium sp.]